MVNDSFESVMEEEAHDRMAGRIFVHSNRKKIADYHWCVEDDNERSWLDSLFDEEKNQNKF